ncbi:MAG: cbb3-type cytochrome c oxidase subunit 3 [Rhodobacteraceae bacterium]|nr:cbb3-type cytochrome c oxidase subunit 3 [Paracoccaceae bacterium]MCB1369053.1 cbb3-type cytochrome c oxidase subunit 3 [Paracoccaceae bacterium]
MDTYSILREFADSWGLLAMFLFFLGVVLWTFRPGSKAIHRDAANIPLRHDDHLESEPASAGNKQTTSKEART